jgi:dihydroorotate dehydrogenase (fumarate)
MTMDLRTTYLGLELAHPVMPGASPLVHELDTVRELEDAGAAAIVMHSLFEEQIRAEELGTIGHYEEHGQSFGEAMSFMPALENFALGPEEYLEQIARIKQTVDLPVIGSLNGATASGWLDYARLIEQAGADALELNVYHVATDPLETAEDIEGRVIEVVRTVKAAVSIPLAVKLSPFYSAMANLATVLVREGADGLVLFNRFFQPELVADDLEVVPQLRLTDASELPLRVQWVAVLRGTLGASLAVSGGVHDAAGAVQAILAGADAIQMVSALLQRGTKQLTVTRNGLARWLEEHEYDSLSQAKGVLSTAKCPDPAAYARGNYLKTLQSWRPTD